MRKFSYISFVCVLLITAAMLYHYPLVLSHTNTEKTKNQISSLIDALNQYKLDHDRYPSNEEGLAYLTREDLNELKTSAILIHIPKDRWGNDYIYLAPDEQNEQVKLYSLGPNEIDDKGMHDDVVSWEKDYTCELNNINCFDPSRITFILLILSILFAVFIVIDFVILTIKRVYIEREST